ncbi:MAG: hypothetical protein PHY92_10740 [Alphaproteobacteria bacterium]|nr:hypothetical protein [Alphaproteobacteria bacterium]
MRQYYVAVAVCFLVLFLSFPAWATDKTDLTVGLKTTPLLINKITGTAAMAVVFDPSNAASKAEADEIKGIIDSGLEAPGGVKITALMVPVSELNKLGEAKMAFITNGLKASFDAIAPAAASAGVLTMSTDLECVKNNKCVLGVVSKPSVEIYYSKSAAEAGKVGFAQAFTMLVKQV